MRNLRKPLLAFAVAGTLAMPALAQQPALSQYPAPCDASKVSKVSVERAHGVFLSGKGYLDVSDYDKAISYFKDAYTIDCSVHAILPIIATAYERKGDRREAVHALEEYLKRVPGASDAELVQQRIVNLKEQIGREQPTAATSPTTTATVTTSATATAPATTTATTAMPTDTGSAGTPPAGGHSVAPWVLVGVGGALVLGGVIVAVIGQSNYADASNKCPNPLMCRSQNVADEGNNGITLRNAGLVVGGVGLAAAVGGIIWHFAETPSPQPATGGLRLSPATGPNYAGLQLHGSF
jgi:hypothetical protein